MLIDIGVNLTSGRFKKDLGEVVAKAEQQNVTKMMVTGTNVAESQEAVVLTRQYPGKLYATAGIHPHHASECSEQALQSINHLLQEDSVVAVGECGLDYNRNYSSPEDQCYCFEEQLKLAVTHQLPVFLHQRDAHADFVSILSQYIDNIPSGVAHCFTGSEHEMHAYIDMGLSIGVTGWVCDERRGLELKSVVDQIPRDRILIETDAPYLLPRDMRPKPKSNRNEPAYLPHICQAVADCYSETFDVVAKQTTENARRLFRLK